MRLIQTLQVGCLAAGTLLSTSPAFAQFPLPKLPGLSKRNKDTAAKGKPGDGSAASAAGVPAPADSPIFVAFHQLEQQPVYRQRMTMSSSDPRMQDMMAQVGFSPAETTTAGDLKQVSMHFQMPLAGKTEDMELRTVMGNGRLAKKWISPGSERYLKEVDAKAAKDLAQMEEQAAKSIARNLSQGPMGIASAAMSGAATAANVAAIGKARKTAHDFFEWTCGDAPAGASTSEHREVPPLTDLRALGDQTVDGVAVNAFEFYVRQNGKPQGPIQMFVVKDSGLPMRIAMTEPGGAGSMKMDYYGFGQESGIEVPACLGK